MKILNKDFLFYINLKVNMENFIIKMFLVVLVEVLVLGLVCIELKMSS